MTTVLSVGNSEGERKCTATCHNATKSECDCVCGSRYHGKGEVAVLVQVGQDVLAGVFGDTRVFGDRTASVETVRFHRRAVEKALRKSQLTLAEASR